MSKMTNRFAAMGASAAAVMALMGCDQKPAAPSDTILFSCKNGDHRAIVKQWGGATGTLEVSYQQGGGIDKFGKRIPVGQSYYQPDVPQAYSKSAIAAAGAACNEQSAKPLYSLIKPVTPQ